MPQDYQKQAANIYTMLLLLALLALCFGMFFLFLGMGPYRWQTKVPPDAQVSWHVSPPPVTSVMT